MATTAYGDISPRTSAYACKELLKRGIPYLVFEKFGQAKNLPSNSSKLEIFRRFTALPTTPNALTEGVTPTAQTLQKVDVTATLVQYGDLITVSDVVTDTIEDPVLNESLELLGEQAAQMIEKMRYGVLKAATNKTFANGTVRSAVNTPFTVALQRKAVRALKRQNARPITSIVRSTPSYGTENVAPGYVGIIHPDMEGALRAAPGFTPAEKYGSISPWENEIGKIDDVRYLCTTIVEPYPDAGGIKGAMLSTSGTSADVYPVIFLGRDAYGIVALKGQYSVTPMVVNAKPSDSDPLAQRSHIGWKSMQTCVILQDAWIAIGEAAVEA